MLPPWWIPVAFACGVLALIVVLIGFVAREIDARAAADPLDSAVPAIMQAEGFRGEPYDDTRGNPTIGYGTKLPLTRAEGELLLRHRLSAEVACIAHGWSGWDNASDATRAALADAGYALGCGGLLGFDDALTALSRGDTAAAAAEFRRSVWYGEEPARVERVIRALGSSLEQIVAPHRRTARRLLPCNCDDGPHPSSPSIGPDRS